MPDRPTDWRPKTLRYAEAVADAERRIVEALPDLIDGLIARAKGGDVKAALYLTDRVLGRSAGAKAAPADDRRMPYGEAQAQSDARNRAMIDSLTSAFQSGASGGE